jgi:Bacterial capsule synthesis protein PGA_cap
VTDGYHGRHRDPPPAGTRALAVASGVVVVAVVAASIGWAATRHRGAEPVAGPSPSGSIAPSSPSGSPTPQRSVTISAVGDTMLGHTPTLPPDPSTYLDAVRSALRRSIAFGNLEGTLTDASVSKCPAPSPAGSASPHSPTPPPTQLCYAFRTPPSYAAYLRAAGFHVLNDANNHSYDFGPAGLEQTLRALDAVHIQHEGLPGQIAVVRRHGVRVAFVGFAPYSFTASLLDVPGARALIRQAGKKADVVVAYMHAGAEGSDAVHVTGAEEVFAGEDRGNPQAFAHAAVDAGADLVVASGPHVLRGMEFYHHRLIAYSLGNFAGYHNFTGGGNLSLSGVLRVTLAEDGTFRAGRFLSLRLDGDGRPVPDPSRASLTLVAGLSRADFGRRAARFASSGAIRPPER